MSGACPPGPISIPSRFRNCSRRIGLIDVREGLDEASFRLAGTRLHDIYGQEITGKRAGEVFSGDCAEYWRRIHDRVVELGLPLHGVVRGPAKDRDHVVLFWLRLPLSEDGGRVDRILCYDVAGPTESDRATERPVLCYPRPQPHAAAAAAGAIRLTPEPAEAGKLPFVGTQQAEMPIQVIAPMA